MSVLCHQCLHQTYQDLILIIEPLQMNITDFVCGLLAGCSHLLVGQPFDYIKVSIQTSKEAKISIRDIAKNIYQKYGLLGFYRGTSSMFLGYTCTTGSQFFIYETAKKTFYKWTHPNEAYDLAKLGLFQVGLSGASAGVFTTFVNCPIQYAKIQRQMRNIHEGSLRLLFKDLFNYGPRKIFKGFWITALREIYGCFFYYLTYESVIRFNTGEDRDTANSKVFLLAGGSAGVCYHCLTYPIDTVKSNIQLGMNLKDAVRNSFQRSKIAGFKVAMMWAISVNSFGFWVYEQAQRGVAHFNTYGETYSLH